MKLKNIAHVMLLLVAACGSGVWIGKGWPNKLIPNVLMAAVGIQLVRIAARLDRSER